MESHHVTKAGQSDCPSLKHKREYACLLPCKNTHTHHTAALMRARQHKIKLVNIKAISRPSNKELAYSGYE
jgi:hypothetical protein